MLNIDAKDVLHDIIGQIMFKTNKKYKSDIQEESP